MEWLLMVFNTIQRSASQFAHILPVSTLIQTIFKAQGMVKILILDKLTFIHLTINSKQGTNNQSIFNLHETKGRKVKT